MWLAQFKCPQNLSFFQNDGDPGICLSPVHYVAAPLEPPVEALGALFPLSSFEHPSFMYHKVMQPPPGTGRQDGHITIHLGGGSSATLMYPGKVPLGSVH